MSAPDNAPPAVATNEAVRAESPAKAAGTDGAGAGVAPSAPAWVIQRHRLPVRIMHWINVLCLVVMLGSGLQIFNAHPALYWGHQSTFDDPWVKLSARNVPGEGLRGETRIGDARFDTTGVLGASRDADGALHARGFPAWSTLPSLKNLAKGRDWHFAFAWIFLVNGALYLLWTFASRHFTRDLLTTRADLRGIGRSVVDHLRFRHPQGEDAIAYNVLQKLSYLAVILVLGPGVVLMGLAMSPYLGPSLDWMIQLVGGRQSARTLHFLIALGFVLFALVHVFEVIVTGFWNNLRSMITGRYVVPEADPVEADPPPAEAAGAEATHGAR